MSAEPAWSKYVILLFSSFMVLSAGTLYGFGAYSANLADALNRSDVNMLGSFGDAGLYTGIILGLFNDKFGPVSTLLVAAFLCWLGNIVMYMAVEGTIDTSTNFGILAAAYYCLGTRLATSRRVFVHVQSMIRNIPRYGVLSRARR